MPATVTVLYPTGAKFDMGYYQKSHMPLVQSKWTTYGLKSWKVLEFNKDAPYCVQATLEFDSLDQFNTAVAGPEAKEVLDDIKNFSDKDPAIMAGDVVCSS